MIGSVYDYYLTTYAGKQTSKYDIHKKSELRSIYNNIVKISKSSPLYKVNVSEDVQKYAIDLKENANLLRDSFSSLLTNDDVITSKSFVSSDDSVVTARNIITPSDTDSTDTTEEKEKNFSFEVLQLATPQVNTGNYLNSNSIDLSKGDHFFEATIGNNSYEFQFNVNDTDTNRTVLEKLTRLINKSNIGIHASVLGNNTNSALEIQSDATGAGFSNELFTITDSTSHPDDEVLNYLGINNISSYSQNAKFMLNGIEKSSSSNTFTINNQVEITLNDVNKTGDTTSVSARTNVDSVLESINDMVNTYNNMMDLAKSKSNETGDSSRLFSDLSRYVKSYSNELESIGLNLDDDKLVFDNSIIIQSANDDTLSESLSKLNNFKSGLVSKSNDISIDPMKYVDKIMISYPNPVRTFANPYVTSIYSGMMYNGYV